MVLATSTVYSRVLQGWPGVLDEFQDAAEEGAVEEDKFEPEQKREFESPDPEEFQTERREFETPQRDLETENREFESGLREFESVPREFESGPREFESEKTEIESEPNVFGLEQREFDSGHKEFESGKREFLEAKAQTSDQGYFQDFAPKSIVLDDNQSIESRFAFPDFPK